MERLTKTPLFCSYHKLGCFQKCPSRYSEKTQLKGFSGGRPGRTRLLVGFCDRPRTREQERPQIKYYIACFMQIDANLLLLRAINQKISRISHSDCYATRIHSLSDFGCTYKARRFYYFFHRFFFFFAALKSSENKSRNVT